MRFPTVRTATGALAAVALTATLVGCGTDPNSPTPASPASPSASATGASPSGAVEPVTLTLGVFGVGPEIRAYRDLADTYEAANPGITVRVRAWADEPEMVEDVLEGGDAPDLFMAGRADLDELVEASAVRPVDDYLDARGVALGDNYARQALENFSRDRRLQCMPYSSSPIVAFVNTELVDFASFPDEELEPPAGDGRWDLEQFRAALENATDPESNPAGRVAGVYVEPTVSGLAPWIEAAGGHVFDDPEAPTSLNFADSDTVEALEQLLPILNDPEFRLTDAELAGRTPLQRFANGRLAVMTGTRAMVPALRARTGLEWDVMQLPGDGASATIGDYTGLCLSETSTDPDLAADLLAYLISEESVGEVAKAGYLVPSNQAVGWSPDFQDDGLKPETASVFVDSIRNMRVLPSRSVVRRLDTATSGDVRTLFGAAWETRLETIVERIDAASEPVLDPEAAAPSTSPSPGQAPTSN